MSNGSMNIIMSVIAACHTESFIIVGRLPRILFPFLTNEDKNLTCYGYSKAEESIDSADPDDYVSIDSGTVN